MSGDVVELIARVVGRICVFRDMEPEEDEDWESWYFAAFDMLLAEVRAIEAQLTAFTPTPPAVTDELVERAAAALEEHMSPDRIARGPFKDKSHGYRKYYEDIARTALTAALEAKQ